MRSQAGPPYKKHPRVTGADAVVRIGPLAGLPALVRDLGCDPDILFTGAGFHPDQFADPDTEIPYLAASRLLARCVTATGCGHLGFLLGERADPSSLGLAGFLLRTAPDVGAALQALADHLDLHDQGGVITVVTIDGVTLFGYAIHQPRVEATDQIHDLSIAIACKIMRSLCGEDWKPKEVLLSRRPPRDLAPYQQHFRAPLRFNAEQNAIVFPTRWLVYRVPSADRLLHRHLAKEALALHDRRQTSLAGELRRLLRRSLGARKCAAGDVARHLHMHERTLNRRLREKGTTFRQELEAVRYEVARQLLTDSEMPLTKIAAALDYADATAFSRAFKRWSGTTPTEWRARSRHP